MCQVRHVSTCKYIEILIKKRVGRILPAAGRLCCAETIASGHHGSIFDQIMGGQKKGLQEAQLKRAKRAQRRAGRRKVAAAVAADNLKESDFEKLAHVEESKDALDVNDTRSQRQQDLENKDARSSVASRLEMPSNSSIAASCYAPTCANINPDKKYSKTEATSNICYSPLCISDNVFEDIDELKSARDEELGRDLKALSELSLELEKTSDQNIFEEPAIDSQNLVTKSFEGRLNKDDSSRSMLEELQDIISEQSIQEECHIDDDTPPPQNYPERGEMCAWELKEFKKTFETIQVDVLNLEARIGKLEEKRARAQKMNGEEEAPEEIMGVPQQIIAKTQAPSDDSDFEEFSQDKEEVWVSQGGIKAIEAWQQNILETEKPWKEDWEDDFPVEELASVLLTVK